MFAVFRVQSIYYLTDKNKYSRHPKSGIYIATEENTCLQYSEYRIYYFTGKNKYSRHPVRNIYCNRGEYMLAVFRVQNILFYRKEQIL